MKFLDEPRLAFWSNFLRSVELGDRVLSVRMEAFSCKKAGDDKRFSKALEQHIMDMSTSAAASPGKITYGTSPSFGLLTEPHVRRTLVDLICTLNATFPDYDFSTMTPDHFEKETGTITVQNKVNAALAEISVINNCSFLENMWADIDTVMKLKDCEVSTRSGPGVTAKLDVESMPPMKCRDIDDFASSGLSLE